MEFEWIFNPSPHKYDIGLCQVVPEGDESV